MFNSLDFKLQTGLLKMLICSLMLLTLLGTGAGLDSDVYVYLSEHVERCFLEELPEGLLLVGNYKMPEAPPVGHKPALIRVLDMNGKEVLREEVAPEGRFAYRAEAPGMHQVCAGSTPGWPKGTDSSAKFHLRLELHGVEAEKEINDDAARKEHLSNLERELLELESKVEVILEDLEYSKQQEKHFRDQGERINGRIMWWSLFQTSLLLLSGIWQIVHLKNFFRAKKLV